MSGILDLLNSPTGNSIIYGVASQTNQPENKTQDVLTMALPVLMQAMSRNAATPKGAEGLLSALQGDRHDGSILENLENFFGGGVDNNVLNDGDKILGHVLGNKQANVQHALSQKSGIDAGTIAQILKVAAPILMGYLGTQAKEKQINSTGGLEKMLRGLLNGNSQQQERSFLESILDADGDVSIIDDVAGMALGGNKKKGGLAGLLGGFFGAK